MQINDITGDTLCTKAITDAYRENWDNIFGEKKVELGTPESIKRLFEQNQSKEIVGKNQILLRNSGYCAVCKEELTSQHRHDFVQCSCGASYVDGGLVYQRCGGSLVDTSIYADDDDIEKIREYFSWGSYGKNGDEPKHYILLKDMSNQHSINILETQWHIKGTQSEKNFLMELEYRKSNNIQVLDK